MDIFTRAFTGKLGQQMVAFIEVEDWDFIINQILKLVNSIKMDLFAG